MLVRSESGKAGLWDGFMLVSGGIIGSIITILVMSGSISLPSHIRGYGGGSVSNRALPDSPYRDEIKAAAAAAGIDPNILHSIVEIESGGDPLAESEAGAQGLGQLMPEIQQAFGVENPFDPTQNLAGSAKFLSILVEKYGRLDLAAAAYHAGEPMVDDCYCVPREVDVEYVRRFMVVYDPVLRPYRIESTMVGNYHGGLLPGRDYAVECNVPLYAPISGEVVATGFDGFVGPHGSNNSFLKINGTGLHSGIEIIMLHGDYSVSIGDEVKQGVSHIGSEQSIGNSTGCHTHLTMRLGGTFVDPVEFVRK